MIDGSYKILYIKADAIFYPIGCLTSNSFNETSEMLPTTTRDNIDGWESSVPTKQSYSISFSGVLTQDDLGGTVVTYGDLVALKRSRTKIEWQIYTNDILDTDSGYGYITSLGDAANVGEIINFNGEIKGYNNPTITAGTPEDTLELIDMIPIYDEAKID